MKLFLFVLVLSASLLQAEPSPREILEGVRISQSAADMDLPGNIRIENRKIPFQLIARHGVITYQFQDPAESIVLRLGTDSAELDRTLDGKSVPVTASGRGDAVRGTDVTLQDLSLDFLYWKNAELLGEQIVGPRKTWKIQLRAPSRETPYAAVIAFVDQSGGALMQMDAYDWNGKIVRRFKVTSGQKIDDQWMLKQMRVEKMDPATGKVVSRTYIEISGE